MATSIIINEITIDNLEDILCERLSNVDFIGQIELDETNFKLFMNLLRRNYGEYSLKSSSIPPATFLTSMVFCARYSSEESRKFWEPYGHLWGMNPDANFQKRCRTHFIKSNTALSRQFGFDFPQKTSGDVVRPVYYHALIPAHLKSDFASWLNKMLPDFMRMETEQIAKDLEDRTHYIAAPTLRTFLLNEDTQPAAIALIAEMLDAVRLYQDGESAEDIRDYLGSIIERDIWEQLLPSIQAGNLPRKRILQPKLEWIWDLDKSQMLLRLRDVISVPESKPYQLVICQPNQLVHDSGWRERIYPWEKEDGTWYIDEHIVDAITNEEVGYLISIVDVDDNLISGSRLTVPPLPKEDIVFWRTTQQGVYALPVLSSAYYDADWIVLLKENASIHTDLEPFSKPDLLDSQYTSAWRGFIKFPIDVRYSDGKKEQLEAKTFTTIHSEVDGQYIEDVSQKVPPIFINTQVCLKLKAPVEQLKRFKLQIEQDERIIKQLKLNKIDIQSQDEYFIINLEPYLQNPIGKFTLNLVRGVSSGLSSPIQFSILPYVEILEYPSADIVYHMEKLPYVVLKNLSHHTKLEYATNDVIVEKQDDIIQITWTNLQNPLCSLVINGVPLAWEIKRIWAWIEHHNLDEIGNIEDLNQAWLHIRGLGYQNFDLVVNEKSYARKLDAKGRFSTQIGKDRIYDLLSSEADKSIRLELHSASDRWILWERLDDVCIEQAQIDYDPFNQLITANIRLSYPLRGRFEYHIISASKQQFSGYYNSLYPIDIINLQIPIHLQAGQYRLILLYCGSALSTGKDLTVFTVPRMVDSLLEGVEPRDGKQKLKLLMLKLQEFEKLEDDRLQNYWSPLRFLTNVRNTSELLPAWAVTENALTCNIIFAGAVKQIILYPEKTLYRGFAGVGKTPIKTNGAWKYAYVFWENKGKYNSEIRLWLPQGSPSSFWDLNSEDMYPVYYSRRDLQFYAEDHFPTAQEITQQDLVEVGYENSLPCEIYPSTILLRYSLKPHSVVDKPYLIAKLEYDDKYRPTKHQARDYRSAIDNFLKLESDRRKQVLEFLSNYRMMLEDFGNALNSHSMIGNVTLSRVTQRFIKSALSGLYNRYLNYYHLDRLIMLLALAVRLKAYYPHLRKEIDALIPEQDLIEIVALVESFGLELFIWALTWVELFAIHAIS